MENLLGLSIVYNFIGLLPVFLTSGNLKKLFIKLWAANLVFGILLTALFVVNHSD
ncbi:MAG: hypothetical protein WC444_03835 [Candidatus Paceibacterota bacterium]